MAQKKSSTQSNTGSSLCQQMAHVVLDDYNEQLLNMVEKSAQGLSMDEIRQFLVDYKATKINDQNGMFKEHFQRCLDRREQEVFDPTRREPFKRILTMRIIDLFAPEGQLDDSGKYLSRRLLPGLFLTLEKMAGSDAFVHGHEICMEVIETIKTDEGLVIWDDLYSDDQALDAVDDLVMGLIPHFDNAMKRSIWMMQLINNGLASPADYDFEGDANIEWILDEKGVLRILRHLLGNLKKQLTDKAHAKALAKKYGVARTRSLAALITVLDHTDV